MLSAVKASVGYFALVFTLGFVLGTLRVLLVAPALGVLAATLIELPFMMLASWRICAWTMRKFNVSGKLNLRLAMGALALALLLAAEAALGVWVFRQTVQQQLAGYREPGPMLGLLAQIAFASFPLMQAGQLSSR
jgi:hypothetical protein